MSEVPMYLEKFPFLRFRWLHVVILLGILLVRNFLTNSVIEIRKLARTHGSTMIVFAQPMM
eukprot:6154010-Karenia_brevis.AAC.1